MRKIIWITDTDGWAFDIRAKDIGKALPQYTHEITSISEVRGEEKKLVELLRKLDECDVVIIPSPFCGIVEAVRDKNKIILLLSSHRSIGEKENTIH